MCQLYYAVTVVHPAYQLCRTQPIISISINLSPNIPQSSSSRPRGPGVEDQFPLDHWVEVPICLCQSQSILLYISLNGKCWLLLLNIRIVPFLPQRSTEQRLQDPPASPPSSPCPLLCRLSHFSYSRECYRKRIEGLEGHAQALSSLSLNTALSTANPHMSLLGSVEWAIISMHVWGLRVVTRPELGREKDSQVLAYRPRTC